MKAWTVSELEKIAGLLQPIVGSRLQEVKTAGNDIALGFYCEGSLLWLWIDLNNLRPTLLPWADLPLALKVQKSPLLLFLKAHFVNKALVKAELERELGRVVKLIFTGDAYLELRLFPHGANLLAFAGGKRIAWEKPREVPAPSADFALNEPRTLEQLREDWLNWRGPKAAKPVKSEDPRLRIQKEIDKREKALGKVKDDLARKQDSPWKAVGDWLKEHQSLEVPKKWEPFVDRRRKLSWNIENSFTRARETEGKLTGTKKRIEILERELSEWRERLQSPHRLPATPAPRSTPVDKLDVKGRSFKIGAMTLMTGKSAADNLKLLRKARAWDLWLHLRDYPSQHAILFRNKNEMVGDAQLYEAAEWFVRQHFGPKFADHRGEKVSLVIAECRHVRPIKGDRIGRVTYRDERILIYRVPS